MYKCLVKGSEEIHWFLCWIGRLQQRKPTSFSNQRKRAHNINRALVFASGLIRINSMLVTFASGGGLFNRMCSLSNLFLERIKTVHGLVS